MIAGRPTELLRQLEAPTAPDRELLARFVSERDQSAFAELVRRHGPVVLGVCRRVTGHQQDAEDAFQAVFLILARKAAGIGKPELLENWLYGVAVHIALRSRRSTVRRRVREIAVNAVPERLIHSNEEFSELGPILDEELSALPSWYRDAIILCDLRGVSREEASAVLGVPEGTLSSRLANGRKKLAARLTKRGITFSAAAIPTTFAATQAAIVPTELLAKTTDLVANWLSGEALPRSLAKLSEGGITVRKTLLFGLFAAAATLATVAYAVQPAQNPGSTEPPKSPLVAPKNEVAENPTPDPKPEDKHVAFTSKPKLQDTIDINCSGRLIAVWNLQGTQLAVQGEPPKGNACNVIVV